MKQKIMHKILENSQKKQTQQIKNPRSRIASVDMTTKKVSQFNEQSVSKSNSKELIYSLQEELRGLNEQITQIQKQCQTNELIQLEMKGGVDQIKQGTIAKNEFIEDQTKQQNSSEMPQSKQINLQRYQQLLDNDQLKDLLIVERNDILKEIQGSIDKDYDCGIKTIQKQQKELKNKKDSIQTAYDLQKHEIDNLSERKAMLKEDLNGKLMQRAELVAQREYLDEILEEFRQKYKQEIEFIEDENQIQNILNNQNQALQQLSSCKKQKQQISQSLLSQIYQKNDQLFDCYQVLCNFYLTKFEQINGYNSLMRNLEQGLNNQLNKYLIPNFNCALEQKANRQNTNNSQTKEEQYQNWVGFSHPNFTDKKKFKDEFYKLKRLHKQRMNTYQEWCEQIYKCDTSEKLQSSLIKKIFTSPPQKLTDETFPYILESFCNDKEVPSFEQEKIMSLLTQYQKMLFEQNTQLEEDRKKEKEQMERVEEQEREIKSLSDKKRLIEKELYILEEEYQQQMVSLKQNQQLIQQKKTILDHNLHYQSDHAFSEYLANEKQIFISLEKAYGMKAVTQIKKEHQKQFLEKIKETQNKRISQLKKIFTDLINLNRSIEFNLQYVENTLFIELNNIESSLLTIRKSIQIKDNDLKYILDQESQFLLKLSIINEARKIYFDNISKIETLNTSQVMITNQSEQNNKIKDSTLEIKSSVGNKVHHLNAPKIQNYFSTERTYYKNSIKENIDKCKQYNTIDQIGVKDSIESDSYIIQDHRHPSCIQSIDGLKSKSRSIFSTIDCPSNDETNYELNSNNKIYYYNTKETKHYNQGVSKSLDNSRRSSMCPITQTCYSSKRQSLNAIVSKPNYHIQHIPNSSNPQNYHVDILNKPPGSLHFSTSISNYMPYAQQQQQQLLLYQQQQQQQQQQQYQQQEQGEQQLEQLQTNNNNNINKILQPRITNIPQNVITNREKDGNGNNALKDQLSRFQHKIVKFNLNNTQLKHISILEAIKPLLEGRQIFKRIGGNQLGGGSSNINQFNPFSLENQTPEQCGYVVRVAHLNKHLTKIEFRNYQYGQKGQKQILNTLDSAISVDHMLRVVVPTTTLDLIKFQKHFDVIGNTNQNSNQHHQHKNNSQESINSSHLQAYTTMNTYSTLKQNDSSFVNNTNISFSNQLPNNYFTASSNGAGGAATYSNGAAGGGGGGNSGNGPITNYSNLSIIHDQNLKMEKILNGNMYPFQIIMDKGNRLDLIAESYETYRIWVNSINTIIKYRKALNSLKTKIEFIIL